MTPELLRIFFRIGMFVTATALFLVLTVPRNSAEYVVSVMSLIVGITLLGLIVLVNLWTKK